MSTKLAAALAIGSDLADSADVRFRKRVLVGAALIILPAGLLWGYLYFVIERLGLVDVKGKGHVETWRLVGAAPGHG